jgi:hypothetical protein
MPCTTGSWRIVVTKIREVKESGQPLRQHVSDNLTRPLLRKDHVLSEYDFGALRLSSSAGCTISVVLTLVAF